MPLTYIQRSIEPVLKKAVLEFPAVVLTGPRQSGKTTLLTHMFIDTFRYVSLETPDVRAAALEDPRGFLEIYSPPIIFDEVQYAPDLLPYIKERIDANRDRRGQYLLTGSQNLLLAGKISESLAGRAATLRLMPLSHREAENFPHKPLPRDTNGPARSNTNIAHQTLWRSFLIGFYPELVSSPNRDFSLWHSSYIQTYLERDVRTIRQVGDLSQFQVFLRTLAARSTRLLTLSDLARDLGIAVNTVKAWISVLEATYQIFVIRPYFANIGKRLVKTPKIYFADVGTLCYLTGLKDYNHAASGPLGGAIAETAVLSEIMKTYIHLGIDPQVHFWRTSTGTEVDIVVELSDKLIPIEVKHTATPQPSMAISIKSFQHDLGEKAEHGYVVHMGNIRLPLGPKVTALSFKDL